jgi:hypothetical protein
VLLEYSPTIVSTGLPHHSRSRTNGACSAETCTTTVTTLEQNHDESGTRLD